MDRYELIGEIASGGMATVYLARLTGVGGFQRFVAMKRLHPHLAGEKEFVEMFLDEARLAAGIHHPNVVPILEVGASPVGYYLVMEYVEGDTLARLLARAAIKGKRLPAAITLRVTLDMLAGLHAAHELRDDVGQPVNLVHRDVSPQNVLVGSDGVARITDFGVARAASRLSATRVGQLKGKIAYMAPEQIQGDELLDRRADVFSAGVVIWEALAAKRLFKADNEAATLSRVMSEPIPELQRLAPQLSPAVCQAVMRALDRDRQRRFASCAQFAEALEAAAEGSEHIASPRELAAYVQEVMGEEIEKQREAVRGWLLRIDPDREASISTGPRLVPSSSVSAVALPEAHLSASRPTLADVPRPAPSRSRLPWLVLVAVLAGGTGYWGMRLIRNGALAESTSTAAPLGSRAAAPTLDPVPALRAPEVTATGPAADSATDSPAPVEAPGGDGAARTEAAPAPSASASAPRPPRASRTPVVVPRPRKPKPDEIPQNPYR